MRRSFIVASLLLLATLGSGCLQDQYAKGYAREGMAAGLNALSDQRQAGGIDNAKALDITAAFELVELGVDLQDIEHAVPTPASQAVTVSTNSSAKTTSLQQVRDAILAAKRGAEVLAGPTAKAQKLNLPLMDSDWAIITQKLADAKQRWYALLRP